MSIPSDSGGKKPRAFMSKPPDWLKAEAGGAQPTSSAPPDWLKSEKPSSITAPGSLPDWLAKIAEVVSGEPEMPAPPAPFMAADEIKAAPPEPEEDLFGALRAQTEKPPVAEMPGWMSAAEAAEGAAGQEE